MVAASIFVNVKVVAEEDRISALGTPKQMLTAEFHPHRRALRRSGEPSRAKYGSSMANGILAHARRERRRWNPRPSQNHVTEATLIRLPELGEALILNDHAPHCDPRPIFTGRPGRRTLEYNGASHEDW